MICQGRLAKRKIDGSGSYAMHGRLFEIAAGLVSEHDAEFVDPLQQRRNSGTRAGKSDGWKDFTSRNSFDVVDTSRNFAKRVLTRG